MKLTTASLLVLSTLLTASANAGLLDTLTGTGDTKAATTQAQTSDLVGSVMTQLGLNQTQAEGGLGSILSLAQSTLGGDDFSPIATAIPGIDGLLSAAPQIDQTSGMSGLLSKAGGLGSSLQGSAMVYGAFEQLGISQELALPMIEIIKGYLDANATGGTADLLMQGLNTLL